MKKFFLHCLSFIFAFNACAQDASENSKALIVAKGSAIIDTSFTMDCSIYKEGWDTLSNVAFWKEIISLNKDSAVVNIAQTRTPLFTLNINEWHQHSDFEKDKLRKQIRAKYNIPDSLNLYFTSGKSDYYLLDSAMHIMSKAKQVFMEQNVNPWYAQAILLIESPGLNRKSPVGAFGPFQLMKEIAKSYGLKVTTVNDERADVKRSAYAASRLIGEVCIPKLKSYFDAQLNGQYNEDDLWFRLLVMHTYHAGAGNVLGALKKINPKKGGMDLITTLWQTSYRGFQNASQNYSQLILATQLIMDEQIQQSKLISALPDDEKSNQKS